MASRARRLPANADGEFFVDDGCIDCGACRWIAPATFGEHRGLSRVRRQPASADEQARALKALIACPVAAIGRASRQDPPPDPGIFPDRIAGDVYYCGYHSPASYGAASWLIVRPQGNVLIDSPRFARPLAERDPALLDDDLLLIPVPGHGDPGNLPAPEMRAAIRRWVAANRRAA